MKESLIFRDQINILLGWFGTWNSCEQSVAAHILCRKMKPNQIRFLYRILQQFDAEADLHTLEAQANNAGKPNNMVIAFCIQVGEKHYCWIFKKFAKVILFEIISNVMLSVLDFVPAFVSKIYQQSKDSAIQKLLECFPLLTSNSVEAKAEYMTIIPKLLSHSVNNQCNIEESKQLLAFALIHPSLTADERCRLNKWLVRLEERPAEVHPPPPPMGNITNEEIQQALAMAEAQTAHALSHSSGHHLDCLSMSQESLGMQSVPIGRAITSSSACCLNRPSSCIGTY